MIRLRSLVLRATWVLLLSAGVGGGAPLAGQGASDAACLTCHGEPEFLRRQAPDRETARALHVDAPLLLGSAHGDVTCGECHTGFVGFPHAESAVSETCASCHEEAQPLWEAGSHSGSDELGVTHAECTDCHGIHDVGFTSDTLGVVDVPALNAECVSCHLEHPLPAGDPHAADSVGCYGCHAPHDTRPVDDPASWLSPLNQADFGCVSCHEEPVADVRTDAHFAALHADPDAPPPPEDDEHEGDDGHGEEEVHPPPTCTDCHGGHVLAGPETAPVLIDQAVVCGECHESYTETFADSYHGQATALGSIVVATCSDCHTGHLVFAADDVRSSVHESNVVETCAECHEESSESFALFQTHADHHDREKYPYVWWSYRLMTGLLLGVFGVFGVHTAFWAGKLAATALTRRRNGGNG